MDFEPLLGRERKGFAIVLDHLAHLADALGALSLATVMTEDVGGALSASVDGGAHLALADAVTVADVQGRTPYPIECHSHLAHSGSFCN
jgi:hypothetical protein